MSEWKKVKLGEILQVKKGEYITKKEAKEGIYPVILGGKEPAYYINKFNHTGKAIVISRSGASAGYVSFWNEPIFVTDGFLIEPKDDVIFEFLYYILKSKQRELHNTQKGAAIPHVTPALIGSIEGLLPDVFTQQNIVSILFRYDSLIENYQKQIKLLEEAAQRLYKEWFVDLHFPGHENTKIVDGVPEGWEKKRLIDIAKLKAGGDKPEVFSKVKTSELKVPIFSNGTIEDGLYGYTEIAEINDQCVTISARGSVGYTVLRRKPFVPIVRLISVIPSNIYVGYLYFFIKGMPIESNGAAQQQITVPMIKNKEVIIPPDIILDSFKEKEESYFRAIENYKEQILSLSEARDRLLPKLMSGEIAVEGRRPERPLSCHPNGNALGMETETNNRPVGAKD